MFRPTWATLVFFFYLLSAYITVKNNLNGGKWFWIMLISNAVPLWAVVSRYSKDVMFDTLLFDALLVLAYTLGLLWFTGGFSKLSWTNYLGLILFILGLFLFKRNLC